MALYAMSRKRSKQTKGEVVKKVLDLEDDNKALWHYNKCLENEVDQLKNMYRQLKEKLNELPQHKQVNRS